MSIENDQNRNDLSSAAGHVPLPTHLINSDAGQDELLPTILIMDDEPVIRKLLRKAFEKIAFNVLEAENGSIGLQIFYREEPDVVLVDLGMPVIGGELVVARIHKTSPDTPVIVISGASLIDDAIGALHLGAWDFITKPFREFSSLYHAVDKALERSRLIRDNRAHQDNLEEQVKERTADLVAANVELKREIHGRHEAEKKIRESEQNYRELVETSQDLIWKCDAEGKFTYLNQAWEQTLGYTIREMLGRPFSCFQRPEVFERDVREFARHLAGGFVKGYETSHISKSGADVHLVFNTIPIFDDDQNVVGTQGTAYDITERKQAEQELRLSEQRLELAHEATGMGMFDWNIEQDQAACNERYFGVFGLKPQERMFSEEDWLALVHPDDRVRAKGHVQDSLAKKAPYDIEYRVVWPDGSVKWVHSKGKVFFDSEGSPERMIGALTDVTERKRTEEDLAERFQFESLLAEMSATFINLPSSKVDSEIRRWLERVATSVGTDRCIVWTVASAGDKYVPSHSWAAAGIRR